MAVQVQIGHDCCYGTVAAVMVDLANRIVVGSVPDKWVRSTDRSIRQMGQFQIDGSVPDRLVSSIDGSVPDRLVSSIDGSFPDRWVSSR